MSKDNMRAIIIINGYPGSGKDTFIEFVSDRMPVVNLHTSTPAKIALKGLGWDGVEKTPEVRKALADFKRLSSNMFDGVMEYINDQLRDIKYIYAKKDWVVFIHSREPEEIERLKTELGAKTLFIDRDMGDLIEELSNDSDRNVKEYNYDLSIENNQTLQELAERADAFVEYYLEGGVW